MKTVPDGPLSYQKFGGFLIEYGSETIILSDDTYVWKGFKWENYYQLREIMYTDDDRKLFPNIIRTDDEGNIRLDSLQLGLCKRKCWEFQQEWRYLIYIGLNDNNKKDTFYRVNKKRKFQTAFLLGLMQNSLKK